MKKAEPKRKAFIQSFIALAILCLLPLALFPPVPHDVEAKTGIIKTKHNLSVTGPGELRALTETRVCVFCHTPHNAAPRTPLWNKAIEPRNYVTYQSSTMAARPRQPDGPSRLCLSCHDGTVALGAVLVPKEGIAMTGEITPGSPSYIGTMLSGHHPVSFSYYASLPNPELAPVPPQDLPLYGNGSVQCSTCHDAHDNTYGDFLLIDNRFSALCTKCHIMDGWNVTSHKTSINVWTGGTPNPWPNTSWLTVAENGCENCHVPHAAAGPERLMRYLEEEQNCYPCHNGNVASKDVQIQFQRVSRHPVDLTTIGLTGQYHLPHEALPVRGRHVECSDCHNPHAANGRPASPPSVSGDLEKVTGVDTNAVPVSPARFQYEVCYKCHSDLGPQVTYVPRYVNTANMRLAFDQGNPSYHPVVGVGRNPSVPSIPSTFEPTLTPQSLIYCTSCHDSNDSPAIGGAGARGPHGSNYPPLLRERYETLDNTPESYQAYALCYRCHNQTSILNDASFTRNPITNRGGHSLHLGPTVNAPCSACHDPHGVPFDATTGDHTNLINFDTRIVTPVAGSLFPTFTDQGVNAGSCTLVCHGVTHNNQSFSPTSLRSIPQRSAPAGIRSRRK